MATVRAPALVVALACTCTLGFGFVQLVVWGGAPLPAAQVLLFGKVTASAAVLSTLLHLVFDTLGPALFAELFAVFAASSSPARDAQWSNCAVNFVAGACIAAYSAPTMLGRYAPRLWWWGSAAAAGTPGLLVECPDDELVVVTGIAVGFMLYDCALMILACEDWVQQRTMKRGYLRQITVHHVMALTIWTYGLLRCRNVFYLCYCLVMDTTLPLLQIRWFLKEHGLEAHPAYFINGLALLVTWLVVRIAPIPFILRPFVDPAAYAEFSTAELLTTIVAVPVPIGLNVYWCYLIIKGAVEALIGGDQASGEGQEKPHKE